MGINQLGGITRQNRPFGTAGVGIEPNSAYERSLRQMGDFNTFSLRNDHYSRMKNRGKFDMPDIAPRYAYNDEDNQSQLNIEAATDAADRLKEYGDKLFDVFDNYGSNYQYLGDNATVSDAQLASRLGQASSEYQANADLQQAEYERDMRRMGVNPNSARFAGFGTSNALHKAAGLSAMQNQVRDTARAESWQRNMDVAGLGLNAAAVGTDGVKGAASVYKIASDMYTDNKIKYDQLNEAARQYDLGYGFKQDELKLAAQNQAFSQGQQRWNSGILQTYQDSGKPTYRESFGYGY